MWGDGSVTRDFIYVGDVANAVYSATINPISGTFNIGTGTGLSLHQILQEITVAVGRPPEVRWLASRSFDVPRIVLDTGKFREVVNWKCLTSLKEGVLLTANWLRDSDI